MIKECTAVGRTVDSAIDLACEQIGCTRDEVQFEIIDLPKKTFLGLKTIPAKVRVFVEASKADAVRDYVKNVLAQMDVEAEIEVKQEENNISLTLNGEGLGCIIGHRGETLDALQYLASLISNRIDGDHCRVSIDSGHYRAKREKALEALALKVARNTVKTGRSSTLEPMNPYERRIIHSAVATVIGAASSSVGEEPNRRVVISSKDAKPRSITGDRGRPNLNRPPRPFRPAGSAPAPQGDRPRETSTPRPAARPPQPFAPRPDRPQTAAPTAPAVPPRPRQQSTYVPQGLADENAVGSREHRDNRGGYDNRDRRPSPTQSGPRTVRPTPPSEAKDSPLYSKIEID